jgi:hypothetical protein
VQPVLVDGAQLELESLVEDVDDFFLALHAASPWLSALPVAQTKLE